MLTYDPVIGRFLSIDPVGFSPTRPDMFNRYAYAGNDPLSKADPDGRDPSCLDHRIGACESYRDSDGDGNEDRGFGGLSIVRALFTSVRKPGDKLYSETDVAGIAEDADEELKKAVQACMSAEVDLGTLGAAAGVASGLPVLPTAPKPTGATQGTSLASATARSVFGDLRTKDIGLPNRVWAPTAGNLGSTTNKVGGLIGRWTPIIGSALLINDAAALNDCISEKTSE